MVRCIRDRDGKVFRVGKVKAYRIHADLAHQSGESVFDVCDAHSQELNEVYAAVFDPFTSDFKDTVRKQFDGQDGQNGQLPVKGSELWAWVGEANGEDGVARLQRAWIPLGTINLVGFSKEVLTDPRLASRPCRGEVIAMKILFLDGLGSNPSGFKPAFLRGQGCDVVYPVLPDKDFDASVRIAHEAWQANAPDVVVGYSRGGAVAMALDADDTPRVLMAPAWRRCEVLPRLRGPVVILHSAGDDLVPLDDSRELLRHSDLPESVLVVVGEDHTMIDQLALDALVAAVSRLGQR